MPITVHKRRSSLSDETSARKFAAYFDHTNLHPASGPAEIERLCQQAATYHFATVCVASRWVKLCTSHLRKLNATDVGVCSVVGFPLGNSLTKAKVLEAETAISDGASEIDMVIAIGDLRAGNHKYVSSDIAAVARTTKSSDAFLKVILETGYLTDDEIAAACRISEQAGANFVKTSSGFAKSDDKMVVSPVTADPRVVSLMRNSVSDAVQVKASGGIKTLEDARTLIEAGSARLGCSSSDIIIRDFLLNKEAYTDDKSFPKNSKAQ